MKKTVKVIVSGDGGVGKTSFLNRLVNDSFNDNSELTRGVDFYSKSIYVNGTEFNFIMWDFAGQTQFKSLLNNFVEGSLAAFILFDLTRISTIENVHDWIVTLETIGHIPIMLIGTKVDLINPNESLAIDNYISEIKQEYDNIITYTKISSKTGENIKDAFKILIGKLLF
ncbi:MAG: GTP-binding protein [Candidatus Lokiarchaeota archaeon]|jgi:small GTP-binding protein|nr:GTP-binding protein [Candidatus Lokiarchaeota archaeon]